MSIEQAMHVASTFDKILSTKFRSPQISVEELDPFTDRHMKQILKWNSKPVEVVDKCIHQVFQEQVQQRGDAEAICAWDGSFTYAEFDKVTSQLASRLVEMGVGPETRVPCCFEKSVGLSPIHIRGYRWLMDCRNGMSLRLLRL